MKKIAADQFADKVRNGDEDMYFCPLPFEQLYNDNIGRWRLCCRAMPFRFEHTVFNSTPSDHWFHPEMDAVRREMLTGKIEKTAHYCAKCLQMEKAGFDSPREQFNRKAVAFHDRKGKNPVFTSALRMLNSRRKRYTLSERVLEFKLRIFGNYCNLRCYMCYPINSTSRIDELAGIKEGYWLDRLSVGDSPAYFESDAYYGQFVRGALKLLPHVKKIKITGGEPFLLKKHYEFLTEVIQTGHARDIRLAYDSNMTAFKLGSDNVLDYLKHFKHVQISVSVDDIGGKNDYIRHGSHFDTLIRNIETAKNFPNIEIVVSCASGMLNAGDVGEIAEYFDNIGIHARFNMSLITNPSFLQARHLPDALKEKYLARLEKSKFRERFENLINMIKQERDEGAFQDFVAYIRDLDEARGTSVLALWPDFEPYF